MKKEILVKGLPVAKGYVEGKIRIIKDTNDLLSVEEGEILVLPNSHPMYALAVMKAAGIICEVGGMLSHICIVSLEMGLPCITQATGAAEKIKDGEMVILNSKEGEVYRNA